MELRSRLLLWASLSALAAGAGGEGARAQSLDVSGSVAIEARVFNEDARFPGQSEDVAPLTGDPMGCGGALYTHAPQPTRRANSKMG